MATYLTEKGFHDRLWPTCAKCNAPVEKFERENNYSNNNKMYGVYCHGEREVFSYTDELISELLDAVQKGELIASKAFEDKIKKIERG
jgi:hypothetical protein